jgi:hypothetical protein
MPEKCGVMVACGVPCKGGCTIEGGWRREDEDCISKEGDKMEMRWMTNLDVCNGKVQTCICKSVRIKWNNMPMRANLYFFS